MFDQDLTPHPRFLGGPPTTGLLMNVVMEDDLPLLYLQHKISSQRPGC